VKLGEAMVEYNPNFRLYLSTNRANPQLSAEIYAKVNVLNFMATSAGLSEQMLGIVVLSEVPDLEAQNEQLRWEVAEYSRLVADMEDKVLEVLSTDVDEKLLDDDAVTTTLAVRSVALCCRESAFPQR
jgi:dynein heavy chain